MEEVMKDIETKLAYLQLLEEDSENNVVQGTLEELEEEHQLWISQLKELWKLKNNAIEVQLKENEEMEKIATWKAKFNKRIASFNAAKARIEQRITEINKDRVNKQRQREEEEYRIRMAREEAEYQTKIAREEDEYQRRKHRQLEEIEIKQKELELREKIPQPTQQISKSNRDEKPKIRLPKLVITSFNGTHMDWPRFWNQFEIEIDKSDIPQVTKYSYLKEMVMPKVRRLIEGLPFNAEGYERAKNILKDKYGRTSEIVNAHVQQIMELPILHGTNPRKVHEFYDKLSHSVQILDTMGRLKDINGYVRMTLDKIPQVRPNLVLLDNNWKDWQFGDLVNALKQWTERNPLIEQYNNIGDSREHKKDRLLQTNSEKWKQPSCVYCNSHDHKPTNCSIITDINKRRELLKTQRRCFNCIGLKHRASDCRSKQKCRQCNGLHHTSICDKVITESTHTTYESTVIYPVVVININGIKCRAMCDTGAGSSYISADLIQKLKIKPSRREFKRIEMMMHTTSRKIEIYEAEVGDLTGKFKMSAEFNKVDKNVLLKLRNPRYEILLRQYHHLAGVTMDDKDTRDELPIHVILGASEYSRIKTTSRPKIGAPGDPVAEYTKLGWTLMSPGRELDLSSIYLTQTSTQDYERLCELDVLGIKDDVDDEDIYKRFTEQLTRDEDGRYSTNLLWKPVDYHLANNKNGSIGRLNSLLRRLEKDPKLLEKYHQIITDQLKEGIIERAEGEPIGKEFYLPHKPVIKEAAESTKVRIVYDASAQERGSEKSLNDCLETGPPLQNLLFDVVLRNRMKPIALTGDMKQAFLQISIRETDRDSLRFHWINDKYHKRIETFRFTRAIFGLVQSPFLLCGTVRHHLETTKLERPALSNQIEEIKDSLYVDDIITGGETEEQVAELKEIAITVFKSARLELHKWHSNLEKLEENLRDNHEQTYAKQQLNIGSDQTKILGLHWNKQEDKIGVIIPNEEATMTKRGILHYLASIYDPLGIMSPSMLSGKQIFREACILKLHWDEQLPLALQKKWKLWIDKLDKNVSVPRSIPQHKENVISIELHSFADASNIGVCASLYVLVHQPSGISKGLLASRSRLSKEGLTIPRLELVAAHMAATLLDKARNIFKRFNIKCIIGWSDSTVVLHWIHGHGNYKPFVANRVKKIRDREFIVWRHVPTDTNPADLGSRGCSGKEIISEIWVQGPKWLTNEIDWPPNIPTVASPDSDSEAKLVKEVMAVTTEEIMDIFQKLLEKHSLWKVLRIMAWIDRFWQRLRYKRKVTGPITTLEVQQQRLSLIKWSQKRFNHDPKFKENKERLNLDLNKDGILECHGRIQDDYPIFIPPGILGEKIIEDSHIRTLHGGVGSTMTHIRKSYWIPKLRQLTKKVIRRCYGCKRFQIMPLKSPIPGPLPKDRTDGQRPFQVVGTDYAGPLICKTKTGKERKVYILIFACSLTRAIHIELVGNQTVEEFIKSFKRFVARRGRPARIYSDNARTFKAAANWLYQIMKKEKFHSYLASEEMDWRFNLSRAPWWGGQYERMIGLVKQTLYKCVGKAYLKWEELEEVLLDIETTLNNRPLSYVEDDIEMTTLTPNLMLYGKASKYLLEGAKISPEDKELRRRAKYLKKCKDAIWQRWRNEYLRGLRERHNLIHKTKDNMNLKQGDVVMIKSHEKNRGRWHIGIVSKLYRGKDNVIRAVELRSGKSYLERAIQHLYPLELSCDMDKENIETKTIEPRPSRIASEEAKRRIRIQAEIENELPEVE